jgi:hypothetical protein
MNNNTQFYLLTIFIPTLILVLVMLFSINKSITFNNGMTIVIKSLPYQYLYAFLLYFLESEECISTSWTYYTLLFFLIPISLIIGLIKFFILIKKHMI